jgi:hypothetical protein
VSRRLVPMPPRKRRPERIQKAQPVVAAIAPSGLRSWHTFVFLIVAAVVWHYFRPLLIVVGALVALLCGLGWLYHRFPRTMFVVLAIVNTLLRSGRR